MLDSKPNGSFLILLTLSAVLVSFIIFLTINLFPARFQQTFSLCQKIVAAVFLNSGRPVQSIILLILAAALMLGIASIVIQIVKTKMLVKEFMHNSMPVMPRLERIITKLTLEKRVYVIKNINCFSFCAGIARPQILITTALIAKLSDLELEAVLLHEKAHLQNFDPAKLLFGKSVSWFFFFLPIMADINKNMHATSEILADKFTISFQKDDTHLRAALRKIITAPNLNLSMWPAIASQDFLEIRIKKIINPSGGTQINISRVNILTSVLFVAGLITFLNIPSDALALSVPQKSAAQCEQNCSSKCQTVIPEPAAVQKTNAIPRYIQGARPAYNN